MKKTIFIILIWIVCFFGGAYACATYGTNKNPAEPTTSVDTEQNTAPVQVTPPPVTPEKNGKVVASFIANGVWYFHFSAYSSCVATVPFAYLLLDNDDVVIVYPTTPKTHKEVKCTPPFTKEEAKIILKAQLGKQPIVSYR
ncbi:MAG: hypothetical protein IJ019_06370 [Alphaproteobacteria bacterium]|nr:hypothetical protein [Alphaproteobacteria bacterium]